MTQADSERTVVKVLVRETSALYVMPQDPPPSLEADHPTVLVMPGVYVGSAVMVGAVGAVLSWRDHVVADQVPMLSAASLALTR